MKDFDNIIKQALNEKADTIKADEALKERIDFMINNKNKVQRRISFKKVAVGLVAVACLTTFGAIARGNIAGLASSIDLTKAYKNVDELNKNAVSISEEISLPKSLAGNKFTLGSIDKVDKLDEEMNKIGYFKEVSADYDDLHLTVHKYDPEIDTVPDPVGKNLKEKDIQGINVKYSTADYLFVPPNYELTDEEKKLEENNEIYVSYGTDERIEQTTSTLTWQDEDLVYTILTFEDIDSDTLFSAADEIINN